MNGIFNPLFGENVEIGENAYNESGGDDEGREDVENLVFHWFALLVRGIDGMNGKRIPRNENQISKSIIRIEQHN
jgi:hypothetical protein